MSLIEIIIKEGEHYEKVVITIQCSNADDIARLIEQIKQFNLTFLGKKGDQTYSIQAQQLYYIESIDSKTFLYLKNHVYESHLKLYEIEKMTELTSFIRISKNLIVNTAKVESVRALFNGRFEANLKNGEKVIVNRHYAKTFKNKFLK